MNLKFYDKPTPFDIFLGFYCIKLNDQTILHSYQLRKRRRRRRNSMFIYLQALKRKINKSKDEKYLPITNKPNGITTEQTHKQKHSICFRFVHQPPFDSVPMLSHYGRRENTAHWLRFKVIII